MTYKPAEKKNIPYHNPLM